jgi:hypothetical protein
MRRITFRADADMLDEARRIAREKGTSLNDEARRWLREFAAATWRPSNKAEPQPPSQTLTDK